MSEVEDGLSGCRGPFNGLMLTAIIVSLAVLVWIFLLV